MFQEDWQSLTPTCYFLLNVVRGTMARTPFVGMVTITCYFLLNVVCLLRLGWLACLLWRCTCYFLLNVVALGSWCGLNLWGRVTSCYFLLNVVDAWNEFQGPGPKEDSLAIFFWMLCVKIESREDLYKKYYLAIFFWMLSSCRKCPSSSHP